MSSNEISVLSDELKPRRTPEPATLEEFPLRPSVPDLSIIESSQATNFPAGVLIEKRSSSNTNPSYNDWRRRTGFLSERFKNPIPTTSVENHNHSGASVMSGSPVNSTSNKRVVLDCITNHAQKYGLSDSAPCVRKTATYSEFRRRPASAPAVKSCPTGIHQPAQTSLPFVNSTGRHLLSHHLRAENNGQFDRTESRNAGFNHSLSPPEDHSHEAAPVALTKHSYSPKKADYQGMGIQSRSGQVKAVSFSKQTQNLNHHPSNTIQHNNCSSPSCIPPDGCCVNLRPCHHNQTYPSYVRPCCGDQGCLSGMFHKTTNLPEIPAVTRSPSTNNPSYDDLYQIVLAQNNELKTLQSQVEKLLITQELKKSYQPEPSHVVSHVGPCRSDPPPPRAGMVCEEGTQTSDTEATSASNQKMSIGVMTSFIHAVAYSGRIGLKGIRGDNCKYMHDNNPKPSSTQSGSDDSEVSSCSVSDDDSLESKKNKLLESCRDCQSKQLPERMLPLKSSKMKQTGTQKSSSGDKKSSKLVKDVHSSDSICSQSGSCNNPGVSAAIHAVRGCQAVLASNTGVRLDESLTFNAADLPTVPEQPVSPLSSIHVDLQDYRESSTDETDSCESEGECRPAKEVTSIPRNDKKPHGWTFYNKVLGQVNQIISESGDTETSSAGCPRNYPKSSKPMVQVLSSSSQKGLDISSKRVAFEAQNGSDKAEHLKELALRYLRENYPEELNSNCPPLSGNIHSGENVQEMTMYNVPAANMSFATFRYLERYNLLPENFNPEQYLEASVNVCGFNRKGNPLLQDGANRLLAEHRGRNLRNVRPKPRQHISHEAQRRSPRKALHKISNKNQDHISPPLKHYHQVNPPPSKILDITALRQQPKLL